MSPTSPSAVAPTLVNYAEFVHRTFGTETGSTIVSIQPGLEDVAIGRWPVPPDVAAPADVFVGYLAPAECSALGLVSSGRQWSLDPGAPEAPTPLHVTVLFDREGASASVLSRPDAEPETISDVPEGWVPDLMSRCLGLSTPPPDTTLGEFIERTWLDRLAQSVFARPGEIRRWRDVARHHPLSREKSTPGVLLAVHTHALEAESSWARMRVLWSRDAPASLPHQVPGGRPIALADWFDDGSFCRWVQRNLPEADQLLPGVLDALPDSVGTELLDALTSVA